MHQPPPESLNMADWFLHARVREGLGARVALRIGDTTVSYAAVQALSHRWAHSLRAHGIVPEQRVLLALPDGLDFVGAFFGALSLGAVVVMLNPELKPEAIAHQYGYTRATLCVTDRDHAPAFAAAAALGAHAPRALIADDPTEIAAREACVEPFPTHPSHRDDAAIWLYSGGTTGQPKAVVQSHGSFVYTTQCYAHGVLGLGPDDITLAVPKLFFGYATGANLLFPFSVGASAVLFAGRSTAEALFAQIAQHRPTVLINVPTIINAMVSQATTPDLSCLRLVTSAGEPLPVELYHRWKARFGVELLDGLGTAEMWHVFLTNHPGHARPGSLGTPVAGFEVRVCDEEGRPVAPGDVGWLWVKGFARAQGYWRNHPQSMTAFRGPWYVSGDMLRQDADGYFYYCGRGDDMLKVAGRWLSPQEVEDCLQAHPAVHEVAVVGLEDAATGLLKPHAWVVRKATGGDEDSLDAGALAERLRGHVEGRLEGFKVPRRVHFVEVMPRTHLGKIDRGALRRGG